MEPAATVIIPTYGTASFACWAVKSVQQQTVKNIEIFIICDGSPKEYLSFFEKMAAEDRRIKVFHFPKSKRTGEPHRDKVIKQARGGIICYCSHDDLWLPNHIAEVEKSMTINSFTHTLHTSINEPKKIRKRHKDIRFVVCVDLNNRLIFKSIFHGSSYFGLTFSAHRRESYFQLPERWVTTPADEWITDRYMWKKFLLKFRDKCRTIRKITALNFPKNPRINWSEQQRYDELEFFFHKIQSPLYLQQLDKLPKYFVLKMYRHILFIPFWKIVSLMQKYFPAAYVSIRDLKRKLSG